MAMKMFNPKTPGLRGTVLTNKSELWKGNPEKNLTIGKVSTGGRNNKGRITTRHKGGGHKKKYRLIDYKRAQHEGQKGKVERLEYDPNRTAYIALINYENAEKTYIIAPANLKKGDIVEEGINSDIKLGSSLPLEAIPVGLTVYNIELKPGKGGQLVRSAGTGAQLVGRDGKYSMLKLPSGESRMVMSACRATIGSVSNSDNKNIKLGKAGRNRWKGIRPTVRGVAMNPVDHPLGGGEGKSSGGRHPVSPWGQIAKGKKTRKPNKMSDKFIKGKKR